MPKVELHIHLDGAFDEALLYQTAQRQLAAGSLPHEISHCVADKSLDEFRAYITCNPAERSLRAMIDKFMVFLPIVQGELSVLQEMARRFVGVQAAHNVLYTEVRYSPHTLTSNATLPSSEEEEAWKRGEGQRGQQGEPTRDEGQKGAEGDVVKNEEKRGSHRLDGSDARQVVYAITRGLELGCSEHPQTEVRQILCFIDGRPEYCSELVQIAAEMKGKGPCGVVGASSSPLSNGATHRAALRCCRSLGLPITIHAAESGPASNVTAAVSGSYGGASRVGHGYKAVESALASCSQRDPKEVAEAFDKLGVPPSLSFEFCPTSSHLTQGWSGKTWKQHPAAMLHKVRAAAGERAADLPMMTLSSDDPSTITDELMLAADMDDGLAISIDGVHQCALNAVDTAFLPPDERMALRKRFESAWAAWEATVG
ncbi:MAG: hypothetical protein SGPRY_010203 [Prymnesium sp.]